MIYNLVCAIVLIAHAHAFQSMVSRLIRTSLQVMLPEDDFNAKDFDDMLKTTGPVWKTASQDSPTIAKLREEQIAREENIYRVYPFDDIKLPVLPDCNNYFSGQFGDYFWHQNADQVYVYIPVEGDVSRKDVEADFQALSVTIKVKGEQQIFFKCLERIIPDGSFWTFEKDPAGKQYIQLDLEKRFRMSTSLLLCPYLVVLIHGI